MSRGSKEPKPYTLKARRGDRPYSYSTEYGTWRNAVLTGRGVREANDAWMRRYAPRYIAKCAA